MNVLTMPFHKYIININVTIACLFIYKYISSVQFSHWALSKSVMPLTAARQALQSITNSQSLLKVMTIEPVMRPNYLIISVLFSSCLQSFPASGCFPMSWVFELGGQKIGASASASVLLMNIQDWFPLLWTGWISLLSKELSRVFSTTQFKNIYSLALSFLYGPTLTSMYDHWKSHNCD